MKEKRKFNKCVIVNSGQGRLHLMGSHLSKRTQDEGPCRQLSVQKVFHAKGTLEGKQRTMPATFEKITNFSVYGKNPLEKETAC